MKHNPPVESTWSKFYLTLHSEAKQIRALLVALEKKTAADDDLATESTAADTTLKEQQRSKGDFATDV